uniref:TIR domain n=2 Tax=Schistocephalus solidus TaxID=70667 RepID=A0A183T247_SCHSO
LKFMVYLQRTMIGVRILEKSTLPDFRFQLLKTDYLGCTSRRLSKRIREPLLAKLRKGEVKSTNSVILAHIVDSGHSKSGLKTQMPAEMNSISSCDASEDEEREVISNIESEMTKRNSNANKLAEIFALTVEQSIRNPSTTEVFTWLRDLSTSMTCRTTRDPWLVNLVDTDECVSFYKNYIEYLISYDLASNLKILNTRPVHTFTKLHMALWNITDKSPEVCCRLTVSNIHRVLFEFINRPELTAPTCWCFRRARTLVHCSIGILHNIINHSPCVRRDYRRFDAVRILVAFTADATICKKTSQNEVLSCRIAALFLLAAIVDEKENAKIHATDTHLVHVLAMLKDALDSSPTHFSSSHGYHAGEIIRSLNKLASPDSNKRSLVKNKALDLAKYALQIAKDLKKRSEDEKVDSIDNTAEKAYSYVSCDSLAAMTIELIWQLSFVTESREYLTPSSELELLCKSFSDKSWSSECQKSVQGLLWNLNSQTEGIHSVIDYSATFAQSIRRPGGHIMISYQHSTQPTMVRLKEELVNLGYKVWIDVDHMSHGSFVDEMAEGVDGASALILGLCQAFKDSPHCRQEMRYAYDLRVPFYPILLEEDYKPDGWLAFMLATIIYIPAFHPDDMPNVARKLSEQLGNCGRMDTLPVPESAPPFTSESSPLVSHHRSQSACVSTQIFRQTILSNPSLEYPMSKPAPHLNIHLDSFDNSNPVVPAVESRGLCEQLTLTPNATNSPGVFFGNTTPHTFDMTVTPIKSPNGNYLSKLTGLTSATESARHAFLEAGSMCKSANSSIIESYRQENLPPSFICSWSAEKVTNWLTECNLSNFTQALDGLDGCLLWELARQRIVAPESFYAHLRSELGMTMVERLRLGFALSRLSILRDD